MDKHNVDIGGIMMIKRINLIDCKDGDVLAEDLMLQNGVIFVTKGTVLNNYIIERVYKLGVKSLDIYRGSVNEFGSASEGFEISYETMVIETGELFRELAAGKPLNYQRVSIVMKHFQKNTNMQDELLRCLIEINQTDEYTYNHCVKTAFYSMMIAKWLKLSEKDIHNAILSGLLHDVGKIKIPDYILNKKESLTKEEFEIIKQHPILGYELIKDCDEIDLEVKKAVLCHHERIDGSGYPYQYQQEKLSIHAKIVAMADVYDAMTSDRVYKKKSTPFEVMEMLQSIGISQFDTDIRNSFLDHLSVCLIGAKVLLNTGDSGKIVYIPAHNITRPILELKSGYLDLGERNSIKILSISN